MKILVVTNVFPPDDRGGYALGCLRTVEALEARGHELRVLTSAPPRKAGGSGRVLPLLVKDAETSPSWQAAFIKELVNQSSFEAVCGEFHPDVVLAFDLRGLSVSLAGQAGELGTPVVIYAASDWLAIWERDIWYRAWPRVEAGFKVLRFLSRRFGLRPVSSGPLESSRVVFVSRHLEAITRQTGKAWARTDIVPWGVDTRRFTPQDSPGRRPTRLLFVGRVQPERGIDIAIRALGRLNKEMGTQALGLTVAGDQRTAPAYTSYLRELASSCGVADKVTFAGFVPPSAMPDLYRAHDIFVFPSAVVESLSVSALEAMASGLGVVTTATGGNAEFLEDGTNALVIPPENAERCASQVLRLVRNPELLASLASRARDTVEKRYSLEATTSILEGILREEARTGRSTGAAPVTEARTSPPRGVPLATLDKLVARAGRWLKWGGFVVLVRNVLRPRKLVKAGRRAIRAASAFVSLLLFPALLEPLFRLAGLRRPRSSANRRPARSVLVVQLADLGDVVLASPFLRELRRHLPQARITLIVQPGLVNIVEKCPYVNEIVPYNWRTVRDWSTAFRGAPGWWWSSLCISRRRLWKRRFDLAVSLRRNNDPCQSAALILMYASGAARRVAYIDRPGDPKLRSPRFVDRLITDGPFREAPRHEVEYQADILRFLGARPESVGLETWTDAADESFARKTLGKPGLAAGGPLVAFAPGARWSFRRWPDERFIELGAWLQEEYGARLVIFAGQSEKPLADRIGSGLRKERTINLAGRTTLRQMAAVLRLCDFFVGIDSGPMHVAAAAGVPVLGLFGPGEYGRFRPWGTEHDVLRLGLSCNPCSESCLYDRALCVEGIGVEEAKRVLAKKLAGVLK